jgi:4-alpha-glucanotransferase
VPDFVRASIRRLGVPGYKVLRWERHWSQPEQPFIDPAEYDEVSVATTGTHDTEALASWWEALPQDDRDRIVTLPTVRRFLRQDAAFLPAPAEYATAIGDALIRALLSSGSRLTIFPFQDLFGWPVRINTPATVDEANWSWRLPWPVDELESLDEPCERAEQLGRWTRDASR